MDKHGITILYHQHHEIFRAKDGKGGIKIVCLYLVTDTFPFNSISDTQGIMAYGHFNNIGMVMHVYI